MHTKYQFFQVVLTLLGLSGCSLINSFDEVNTKNPLLNNLGGASGQGGSNVSGAAGTTAGSSGDSGGGGVSGQGGAGQGGSAGQSGAAGGVTKDGGLIVVSGTTQAPANKPTLQVLDPVDGKELLSEDINIVAILYEVKNDYWYLFEKITSPTVKVQLHVRTFNQNTNAWTNITDSPVEVPSPEVATITLLNGIIAYHVFDSMNGYSLATINISDPKKIAKIGEPQVIPIEKGSPVGLVGLVGGTTGGVANNIFSSNCNLDPATMQDFCDLSFQRVSIGNTAPSLSGPTVTIGKVPSQSGSSWAVDQDKNLFTFVLPPLPPHANPKASFYTYATSGSTPVTTTNIDLVNPGTSNHYISDVTIAKCQQVALITELKTNSLIALPLNEAVAASTQNIDLPPQTVIFEPYTDTVIIPRQNANAGMLAFKISYDKVSPVTFADRGPGGLGTWNPPTSVVPKVVETRNKKSCQ
jgi:hypothetical protein